VRGKDASKAWIADRATELLKSTPALGAKKLQLELERQFPIKMSYTKVWEGSKLALEGLHGSWEESFRSLWSFKAELEATCPGSIVEIDCKKLKNGQVYFRRMFVAIKACVDGFLAGCRPYLGVDSTHLTGKYNGQLAAATSIDGHNWMYPVAYGIFYKETKADWTWFLKQLKRAIGTPHGLTIHTDACKGLETAVHNVFQGDVEHRECFRHLMHNFRKHFDGDVLKYMWPCAWACTPRRHRWLWDKIAENCPEAIPYLEAEHKQVWSRAKFSGECKVDYVNNNISECFNNWIKETKGLPVDVLVDTIRGMIMEKIDMRQRIANKLEGSILPSVKNELNMKSRNLKYTIKGSGGLKAEVSGLTKDNYPWRHAVDLDSRTCSCGQWHISGKPCTHAIAFIGSLRGIKLEHFVHEYYSVQRFKATYHFGVNPMVDKSQWPIVDPGFVMLPPKLERSAGRPRVKRIKSKGEPGKRGPYQCKRCFQFGHIEKGCTEPPTDLTVEMPPAAPKNSR